VANSSDLGGLPSPGVLRLTRACGHRRPRRGTKLGRIARERTDRRSRRTVRVLGALHDDEAPVVEISRSDLVAFRELVVCSNDQEERRRGRQGIETRSLLLAIATLAVALLDRTSTTSGEFGHGPKSISTEVCSTPRASPLGLRCVRRHAEREQSPQEIDSRSCSSERRVRPRAHALGTLILRLRVGSRPEQPLCGEDEVKFLAQNNKTSADARKDDQMNTHS